MVTVFILYPKTGKAKGFLNTIPNDNCFVTLRIIHVSDPIAKHSVKRYILINRRFYFKFVKLYAVETIVSKETIMLII